MKLGLLIVLLPHGLRDFWITLYVLQKANPLIDEAESCNSADLQRDHPNQREKPETQKNLLREVRNGRWKMQCLTYMCEYTKVTRFKKTIGIWTFLRALNAILKSELQKEKAEQINVKLCMSVQTSCPH
jgi:hypothetical protein